MAVIKHFEEIKVRVPSHRMFKAIIVDPYTLLPKIMPATIKSVDLLHGNGGVGSITRTNYPDGSPILYVKNKINAIDTVNCTAKFSVIEGGELGENLESIDFEVKFEQSGDGGCVVKLTGAYNAKGDVVLKDEDIKTENDRAKAFYTGVEEYLVVNPNVCG